MEEVKRKWGRIPITPAPTPAGEKGPYEVYARNQRCLQAELVSSFITRRLEGGDDDEAAFGAYALPDPLDDCYRECHFVAGLDPLYCFAVDNAGVCYCCKEWCVVFVV